MQSCSLTLLMDGGGKKKETSGYARRRRHHHRRRHRLSPVTAEFFFCIFYAQDVQSLVGDPNDDSRRKCLMFTLAPSRPLPPRREYMLQCGLFFVVSNTVCVMRLLFHNFFSCFVPPFIYFLRSLRVCVNSPLPAAAYYYPHRLCNRM